MREHFWLYLVGNLRADLQHALPFVRAIRNPFGTLAGSTFDDVIRRRSVQLRIREFAAAEGLLQLRHDDVRTRAARLSPDTHTHWNCHSAPNHDLRRVTVVHLRSGPNPRWTPGARDAQLRLCQSAPLTMASGGATQILTTAYCLRRLVSFVAGRACSRAFGRRSSCPWPLKTGPVVGNEHDSADLEVAPPAVREAISTSTSLVTESCNDIRSCGGPGGHPRSFRHRNTTSNERTKPQVRGV